MQAFFCEHCEIFKNSHSEEYLQTAASVKTPLKLNKIYGVITVKYYQNSVIHSGLLQTVVRLDFTF